MATKYVDANASGANDGSSWSDAYETWDDFDTWANASITAGDIVYIKPGAYTASGTFSHLATDGNSTSPIKLIGVESDGTTWATGDNRPAISFGNYSFGTGGYWQLFNLQFSGAGTSYTVAMDSYPYQNFASNCKFENTNSGDGIQNAGILTNCECISTSGYAIDTGSGVCAYACYIHDSSTGIYIDAAESCFMNCIIDSCTTGINCTDEYRVRFCNNTIYGCTDGIIGTTSYQGYFLNNTISNNSGWGWKFDNSGTVIASTVFDYNNWYSNTSGDMTWDNGSTEDNSAKGPNALAVNPNFNNAAAGDFSLQSSSNLIDAGMSMTLGVG